MRVAPLIRLSSNQGLSFFHFLLNSYSESQSSRPPLAVFRELLKTDVKPNDFTFSLLVKACASAFNSLNSVYDASQIQAHLIKFGFDQYVYVSTALLDLFMKFGCTRNAQHVFDHMPYKDVVIWNALICGYSRNGHPLDALKLFPQMLSEGFSPCHTTMVILAPSCGWSELASQGESLHGFAIRVGLDTDSEVKNAFTFMYAKCGNLEAAELLFKEMVVKNVVSWNTMVGAYGQNGFYDDAMLAFNQMRVENVKANPVTIVSLLSANAHPESTHCYITKTGIANDASVVTSLICVYAKCGRIESAEFLYKTLPEKNLVSSTAIISAHSEKGNVDPVMKHLRELQQFDVKLDAVAMVGILQSLRGHNCFKIGLASHGYALKNGLSTDCLVANGLMSMYSKFNSMQAVLTLFSEMHRKSLTSWNTAISACVQAGKLSDALEFFCHMRMSGHTPDAVTITNLLCGCSQQGFLQLGIRLHNYVLRNKIEIDEFVGTALIDLYSKCGSIIYAEKVFKSVKDPCLAAWNAMISGYSLCAFEQKALDCFLQMRDKGIEPDEISFLGVLAACTHGGFLQEGARYFQMMTEDFGIVPNVQHYACIVGLLGHTGLLEEAMIFIKNMEVETDSAVWIALLSACCIHHELKLAECLAKKLLFSDYNDDGYFVLMSNLYAAKERWIDVARVREMMREARGDACSGISIIEVSSSEETKENLSVGEVILNLNSSSGL